EKAAHPIHYLLLGKQPRSRGLWRKSGDNRSTTGCSTTDAAASQSASANRWFNSASGNKAQINENTAQRHRLFH
ncbi:hypothetical protein MXD63_41470, partial [Frankia sp. Cpl3]|nr:hypothetical protein [Frankia sp. Cpl3]